MLAPPQYSPCVRTRAAALPVALALAVFLLAALPGCAAPGHRAPHRARFLVDKSIERYDFADATWESDAGRVTLHGGHGTVPVADDSQTAEIRRGPVFSDVNGDGAEDAAVELYEEGSQNYSGAWYVWLWQDGTAVQQQEPFIDFSRCSGQVDSVTAVAGGFQVKQEFANPDNPCSTGGVVPITYTISVRDGFLVQVAPVLGELPCDPAYLTVPVTVPKPVTPRAAEDDKAPALAHDHRYPHAYVGSYETPEAGEVKPWTNVLLDDGTNPPFCGYLHTSDVEFTG
jgi:hypothetical protein